MSKTRRLGRGVSLVGAGMSRFGMFDDRDSKDLFLEAFEEMRESVDKGLDPNDIDALYVGNFTNDLFVQQSHWGAILTDALGLIPKPATRTEGACASSALAFREGVFAIASGYYDMVLVGGFEEMSKRSTEEVAEGLALAASPYERSAGFTFPGVFGAMATAYFDRYGATREHLMNVTIKSHNNARSNPKAQHQRTIQQIMKSRIERATQKGDPAPTWETEKEFLADPRANPAIAWPMHLFDCSPISDGASCVLLVADELAASFTDAPIHVRGLGQASGRALHAADDLTFFEAGTGYKAVEEGLTKIDGSKPINSSGGLKCKGHPVGATGTAQMIEIWHQLRQTAQERQIPNQDLHLGMTQSIGGTGGTCAVTILERR